MTEMLTIEPVGWLNRLRFEVYDRWPWAGQCSLLGRAWIRLVSPGAQTEFPVQSGAWAADSIWRRRR